MEELGKEIHANIRSCLLSTKEKCDLKQLKSDYRMLMGTDIPFKKLNFNSLEELLGSMDGVVITKGPGGVIFVSAKPNDKSSHLTELISKQKSGKRRRMPFKQHRKPLIYNNNNTTNNRWRPTNVNNKWKTVYQHPPRLAAVSHNQIVRVNPSPIAARISNVKDLRQILDLKRTVSFESTDSMSSSSSTDKVPHSDRTNRAHVLVGVLPRKAAPPVLSPTTIENLKNSSMTAADPRSPVWDTWSSSEASDAAISSRPNADRFSQTGDSLVDLYVFAQLRKLPEPVFKIANRKSRSQKVISFDCKVDIGEHAYSTYPKDFGDATSAKQYAAKLALDDLMPRYTKRKSLLISNDQDVLARIPLMVEQHYHGIWNWQLEADYCDLYNEQLPLNWLQIVDTSPKVSVESFQDKYVLRYCKPEDKGRRSMGGLATEVSVPTNTIVIGEDGSLIAEITCVVSAKEVWCRQIGTAESEAFNMMISNFDNVYSEGPNTKSERLSEGSYCAAYYDQNWYRVKIFEVNENDVNCFLIDYGDEQLISKDDVYQLRREFAKQKAQAFICRLAGLEELYEVSASSEHLQNLVGKTVHMETDTIEDVNHDTGAPISVILYDPETSASINQELIACITIESATPVLNKTGVTQVFVCHAESNGDVYVQIQSPGFEKLENLIAELEASVLENAPTLPTKPITPDDDLDRLYFGQFKEDGHWYRLKILDWAPGGCYAQIYFVDYGNWKAIKVSAETLYPLDELSDVINKFPAQAVRVKMQMDKVPKDFVDKVDKLMPGDQPVLLKVIDDHEGIPVVQFFTRIGPNNELCSINQSIVFETEQEGVNARPERLQRLRSLTKIDDTKNKNVPSTGILTCPALPKIGEYFDVRIPTAVNPWNFFVQPYNSYVELAKLMKSLQSTYGNVIHSPLQIDDVQPGRIYASKHEDGKWYRTSVMKVIHPGSISVFYCDFGYYDNLTLQQLIPLEPQFLDLPYQAIKAKLSGIKPKQSKWTMDDCNFFQALVLRKTFVSILVSIEKDELYKCDNVLNLKLVDTSTDKDIHINEVLIRKGIAVQDSSTSNGNKNAI